jgi:flagellar basal-body rod protein FlgB
MDPSRLGLFELAQKRLGWLDQRQQVLARNIANADTPGWRGRDLRPFADVLADATGVAPARPNARHMAGLLDPARNASVPSPGPTRMPDGNDVSVDDQLLRVANTETQQALVTNVMRKYVGLLRLALGRGP